MKISRPKKILAAAVISAGLILSAWGAKDILLKRSMWNKIDPSGMRELKINFFDKGADRTIKKDKRLKVRMGFETGDFKTISQLHDDLALINILESKLRDIKSAVETREGKLREKDLITLSDMLIDLENIKFIDIKKIKEEIVKLRGLPRSKY